MNKLYQNANGKEYKIHAMVGEVGLLESMSKSSVTPFIVVIDFNPYVSSWGGGQYYKTLEEAKVMFKKRICL